MRLHLIALAVFAVVVAAAPAGGVTFNDGGTHLIDSLAMSYRAENVVVDAAPGGAPTTMTVSATGELATAEGAGGARPLPHSVTVGSGSLLQVDGGRIGLVRVEDHSRLNQTDGVIGEVLVSSTTVTNFNGGTTRAVKATGAATVTVTLGGEIRGDLVLTDTSGVVVGTGEIGSLVVTDAATAQLQGGANVRRLSAFDDATVTIKGGLSAAGTVGELDAHDASAIEIRGSSFNLAFGPVANTGGTITGTLEQGQTIDATFSRATTATITLVEAP